MRKRGFPAAATDRARRQLQLELALLERSTKGYRETRLTSDASRSSSSSHGNGEELVVGVSSDERHHRPTDGLVET